MNDATLAATGTLAKPARTQSQFRLIAACSLGNALEMFDFTVYSFFSLLIGKLFFPSDNPYGSLLLAVALMVSGGSDVHELNPGFPPNGKWIVHSEGILPLP